MRAHEFITEVLDLSGSAPTASWEHDIDSLGNKVSVGTWKDDTGRNIENWFTKDPKGDVKVDFTRTDSRGEPLYSVTGTGQGKQTSIMTGVTKHFKDYIANNPDVNRYRFTSSADSRTRLYNKMLDRLAPTFGMVATKTWNPDLERTEYELKKAQPGEVHKPLAEPRSGSSTNKVSLQRPQGYKSGGSMRSAMGISGPLSGGGVVPTGAGDLLHQMNPQKLY